MPDTLERTPPDVGQPPLGERAAFRLAAFAAVLIVTLFAGYGLGRLNNGKNSTNGNNQEAPAHGAAALIDESQPHSHDGGAAATESHAGSAVGGLALSSSGLTLVPVTSVFPAGRTTRFAFAVTGAGRAPITTYAVVHDKPLHLIVVRRDLTGFQHLHPTMAPDGTWGIDLTLAAPGSYRAIADFTAIVGGREVPATLGVDLTVAGGYAPVALPAPVRQATTSGFQVTYAGTPVTEATQPVLVSVTGPDGRPAAVEPYLGAYGHLVVMRAGDLGYVHVHPEPRLVDGKVKFWLTAPSTGDYRMFFDFQVAGRVHTAEWTMTVR